MARKSAPKPFGPSGARLWDQVNAEFELATHEAELLRQACRTLDTIDALQTVIDRDGVTWRKSFEDTRPHPLLCELRSQRSTYRVLIKALKLPLGVEGEPAGKVRHGVRELRAVKSPGGLA